MPTQVIIPVLGEAIAEAQLVTWLKEPGQLVQRGDELAELETDKATLTVECPANGVLLSIFASPGEKVFPGQVIAAVGQPGEQIDIPSSTNLSISKQTVETRSDPIEMHVGGRSQRVSPAARQLAKEMNIDLDLVAAAAPGARITSEDVHHYLVEVKREKTDINLPQFHRQELTIAGRALADKMVESASKIPQFSVSMDVNVDHLLAYKANFQEQGQDVSVTSVLIYVISRVMHRHPFINSRFDNNGILIFETVNIAVAVATSQGLVAPVLFAVEKLDLVEISGQLDKLIQSARENRLRLDQITSGTFTISNLGMYGVNQFVPLVYPPQAAILGIGGIRKMTLPTGQEINNNHFMSITVSADHRILDGVYVAQFLADIRDTLENL